MKMVVLFFHISNDEPNGESYAKGGKVQTDLGPIKKGDIDKYGDIEEIYYEVVVWGVEPKEGESDDRQIDIADSYSEAKKIAKKTRKEVKKGENIVIYAKPELEIKSEVETIRYVDGGFYAKGGKIDREEPIVEFEVKTGEREYIVLYRPSSDGMKDISKISDEELINEYWGGDAEKTEYGYDVGDAYVDVYRRMTMGEYIDRGYAKGGKTDRMFNIVHTDINGEKSFSEVPAKDEQEALAKLNKVLDPYKNKIISISEIKEVDKLGSITTAQEYHYARDKEYGRRIDMGIIHKDTDENFMNFDEEYFNELVDKGIIDTNKYYAKGGKLPTAEEIYEGEFLDEFAVDESYTCSNCGDAEVFRYKGKVYQVITWNERAQDNEPYSVEVSEIEDYEHLAKGGMIKNKGYFVAIDKDGNALTLFQADSGKWDEVTRSKEEAEKIRFKRNCR